LAEEAEMFLPELGSAQGYETYYQASGGLYPYDIWVSRLAMLKGRFQDALQSIETIISTAAIEADDPIYPSLLVDRAYCEFRVGLSDRFEARAREALSFDLTKLHADDRAVLHCYCAEIFAASGRNDVAEEHMHLRSVDVALFAAEVQSVRKVAEQAAQQLSSSFRDRN
jgi:hypothetical protein